MFTYLYDKIGCHGEVFGVDTPRNRFEGMEHQDDCLGHLSEGTPRLDNNHNLRRIQLIVIRNLGFRGVLEGG